jgi:glycine/D-amino acid oxidase-like deaminating enzyme
VTQKHVIVVGGGIIGASFAYHLATAGARVTLLDETREAGGVATSKSWAWINASWGNAEPYFRLRHHSMALWRKLDKAVPGLQVNWCGGLLWDLPEKDLRAYAKQQAGWGYDIRLVNRRKIEDLEPQLLEPPALAAHAPGEGAVEPVHAVESLLAAARGQGAQVLRGVRAIRAVEKGDVTTGVMTVDGVLDCDELVLAAGAATPQLLRGMGVELRLDTPPGLLVSSEPAPELLRGLVMAPEFHVRQRADGALVAGGDFGGSDPGEDPEGAARQLFDKVKAALRGAQSLKLAEYTIGHRPTPADGVSAIGRIEGKRGLYICVTHSGITLAPVLGLLGAAEIAGGGRDPSLAPFAPARLLAAQTQ